MGNVLKGHRYRIVDNRSFELPLPVKYVLLKEDNEIAEYEISAKEEVSYKIITKYKENMITPITRPLTIADIYYFFSCRVFQDRTPFTGTELSLLGLERYNVYDIIRKTRGITPYDNYWLRFDGDKCAYHEAKSAWDELMSNVNANAPGSTAPQSPEAAAMNSGADINEILNQHKVDVASKIPDIANMPAPEAVPAPAPAPVAEPETSGSNTMSAAEIEALLMQTGLSSGFEEADEDTGEEESKSSGGAMSQDDIEKMLASVGAVEETPAPVEEPKSSGGKMSQDDIEKMLAAAGEAVAEAAPAEETPAPQDTHEEEPKPSGGKMSQDDIEKMLAAAGEAVAEAAQAEETPAPEETHEEEPKSSGGKMSQDDIEKMLAAASEAVQEPLISEPEQPVLEEPASSEPAASETEAKPDSNPASSGGKMSQADIEALLNGMADDAQ